MSTSSFRVWILFPWLTVFVALLALGPAYGRTDTTQAPRGRSRVPVAQRMPGLLRAA